MIYQTSHNHFLLKHKHNHNFPSHLHENFELITIKDGEMAVRVDQNEYLLKKGDAVLVFPNQIHSLHTNVHSFDQICIFSPHLVTAYKNTFSKKQPKNNLFRPTPFYLDTLFSLNEDSNALQIKGILYSICAEFDGAADYTECKNKEENLLMKIFKFVESNYTKECSLGALAEQISYHEVYLSRYFKKRTGLAFSDYVNQYRINESVYILKNTNKKIIDIALDCGFNSLRTFNRNFKEIIGMTPTKYRHDEANAP